MVINAGIKRIVVRKGYPDELSRQILKEAKLKAELFKPEGK
jgi:dCMP deaminase